MAQSSLEQAVAALLVKIGRGGVAFRLEPLSASGNNRVFTLFIDNERLVLKWYFHDVTDERDRLAAEYAFLEHAWSIGLRCIPRPIGKDLTQHLAIYEFVEGRKLEPSQVDGLAISQAAQFFSNLNSHHAPTKLSVPDLAQSNHITRYALWPLPGQPDLGKALPLPDC